MFEKTHIPYNGYARELYESTQEFINGINSSELKNILHNLQMSYINMIAAYEHNIECWKLKIEHGYKEQQTILDYLNNKGYSYQEEHKDATLEVIRKNLVTLQKQSDSLNDYVIEFNNKILEYGAEISSVCDNIAFSIMEKQVDWLENSVNSRDVQIKQYQKGPKKKSSDSRQKWALANEYFKAEIPVHRTLKSARLAAAKKAGVVAEERQLTKMMPDPR